MSSFSSFKTPVLAAVTAIFEAAPQHFLLSLDAPAIALLSQAGQFVHVLPRSGLQSDPLLRRAFSIMRVRGREIDLLFRVEGKGTAWMSRLRVGEALDVLGPLGKPFDLRPFHVKQNLHPILVGGGVGVPPLVFLAQTLHDLGLKPLILVGARAATDVLGEQDFERLGLPMRVATDDGSRGHQGRVTELLEKALDEARKMGDSSVIYACGPLPMLRAVAGVASSYHTPCQVSLEENMPCGIGVCNGCVVAMKSDSQSTDYERYRRICVAGPAMWAQEIDWPLESEKPGSQDADANGEAA